MDETAVISKLKADLTWLQKHEKLVLAVILSVALWFTIGKIDTLLVNHAAGQLAQAKVTAEADAKIIAARDVLIAQQAADYKALYAEKETQNAQLEQANKSLSMALATRQKTDSTLPPSDLAARWDTLVPAAGATVIPSGISVSQAGAVATVQQLELVPVQQEKLANVQTELDNANQLISAEGQQMVTASEQIASLKKASVDDAKVCKDDIAMAKSVARKSKLHWFEAGYVAGLATRGLIRIFAGF